MLIESLLSRADDHTLQELLGRQPVRLIRLLSGEAMRMEPLRRALLSLRSPTELLLDRESRSLLLELLRPDEARTLTTLLDMAGPDPYAALREQPIRRGTGRAAALLDYFGVPPPPVTPAESVPASEGSVPAYALFEHQRIAVRKVEGLLCAEPHRAVLHMPTGAGKTRVAMNLIAQHLRRRESTLVVWLAYSEELCEQAAQEFLRAWTCLGDREATVFRFWGAHEPRGGWPTDGLLVAGLGKLFAVAKRSIESIDRLRRLASLVVMDEAHQSVAETYSTLLDVLLSSNTTALLGLTATPGRTWNDPGEDEKLSKYYARRKVSLEVPGYTNPVKYLIEAGYLAEPSISPILYRPGVKLTAKDIEEIERSFDLPDRIVRQLADDDQRNLAVLNAVEQMTRRHRRIILFAASVGHATLLSSVLRARSVHSYCVTGATPTAEREQTIRKFRSDDPGPMVLCNFGVLTAGFDAPATSAAVIARPTKSLVLYSQMIGRATRGLKAGGNATAEIAVVQDPSLPGFGSVADAFFNWEDVWNHA